MYSGWFFILLSAGSSIFIAHFLKTSESRNLNTVRILTINYLSAFIIAFLPGINPDLPELFKPEIIPVFVIGGITGALFIINFFVYSKSVFHNGVGISIAAMRLSLMIPVMISVLWYLEYISFQQWIGVGSVCCALFLLIPARKKVLFKNINVKYLLVILFLLTGLGDASLKIFESDYSGLIRKEHFMGLVFFTAFLIGIFYLGWKRQIKPSKSEWAMGFLIGVPNFYSSIFLIEALERMNGAIVYSGVNIFTVLGGTLLGMFRWGDQLTRTQWWGIVLTIVSILLLIYKL